jgi:Dolichyl-phosphate-mannose-protein mannosyltransferase
VSGNDYLMGRLGASSRRIVVNRAIQETESSVLSAGSSASVGSPVAQRPPRTLEVWSAVAAVALAIFYFATSLYIAGHRPFWVDELLTVDIARLPDLRTIWSAVTHAVDGGSPVYDVVVRGSLKLPAGEEIAARLPSALAMVAGMLIVFDCARRLTDSLHGLIAISVLMCSFLPYYGHEARAYTLYFMLAALSLWIWVHTRDNSWASAALFGAAIFLAVAMHYYAVLLLVPYGIWELMHWRPWQRPPPKLLAGIAGAAAALLMLLPAIRSFAPVVIVYNRVAGPSFDGLREVFSTLFPNGLWLLALIAIWVALVKTRGAEVRLQPMDRAETVGWLFLCIPLAGFVVAELKTHAFLGRYFIGALPGIAVAFACCVWRNVHQAWRVSVGVLLILATYGIAQQVAAARHPGHDAPIRHDDKIEEVLRKDGKRFFVLSNQARHLEALHYAKHPEEYAYLASLDSGDQHQTMALARYVPMQFWTLDDLKKHAPETALIAPYPRIVETLKQAGIQVDVRSANPLVVYLR